MTATRLSPLDASFLAVESPTAHMHVGWAAAFKPPAGERPSFDDLFDHVAGRVSRGARFRQRLASVPLGLNAPLWIDDQRFDPARHIVRASSSTLGEVVDGCLSDQLDREKPLWQICIADRLDDGRVGVVGKAHHCMVDGIAAVELAALLLDPTPEPEPPAPDGWRPAPTPAALSRLAGGVLDQIRGDLELLRVPGRVARSPLHAVGVARKGLGAVKAAASMLRPAHPIPALNGPISPLRHLATARLPLADLKTIRSGYGTTVNDVVLAAAAGGVRRLLEQRAEPPVRLKTMVPVNVREPGEDGHPGNRISFMFVDLPCDEPDPVRRLRSIHGDTVERKGGGESRWVSDILGAVGYFPQPVRDAVSHVIASPLVFNLTVSNIPGPTEPMYMLGCELEEAYPVVPIADRHALSIGVTTIRDQACFGVYADRELLPDADVVADAIDESVAELLALAPSG
jgi:diacylglycerol O-acyltransferase / wax synthase